MWLRSAAWSSADNEKAHPGRPRLRQRSALAVSFSGSDGRPGQEGTSGRRERREDI